MDITFIIFNKYNMGLKFSTQIRPIINQEVNITIPKKYIYRSCSQCNTKIKIEYSNYVNIEPFIFNHNCKNTEETMLILEDIE